MKKNRNKVITRFFITTMLLTVLFSCSKNNSSDIQKQEMPDLTATRQNVNLDDSVFAQYSNSVVEAMFEIASTSIGYDEWVFKVDSILNSPDTPSFSSIFGNLQQLNDSSYKQLFDSFFMNIGTIDVCHSAEMVERQLLLSSCNENEKFFYLGVLSYMKTMLEAVEGMQEYMPGPGYDRYLDCMREKHANMNWADWTAFVLGIPESFVWEVASCIWDATHQEQ